MGISVPGFIVPYERVFYRGCQEDTLGIVFPSEVDYNVLFSVAGHFRDYIASEFEQDYSIQKLRLDERSFCNIGEKTSNGVIPTYWVRFFPEGHSSDVIAIEKFLGWARSDTEVRSYGRLLARE